VDCGEAIVAGRGAVTAPVSGVEMKHVAGQDRVRLSARRNSVHDGPTRRGDGSRPELLLRILQTVEVPISGNWSARHSNPGLRLFRDLPARRGEVDLNARGCCFTPRGRLFTPSARAARCPAGQPVSARARRRSFANAASSLASCPSARACSSRTSQPKAKPLPPWTAAAAPNSRSSPRAMRES
jgi:hypothetical protein